MTRGILVVVLAFGLALPAQAQPAADVPLLTLDSKEVLSPCQPGDIVLHPEAYRALDKRVSVAEAKVEVYEKHEPLPWWGIAIIAGSAALLGAGAGIGIYVAVQSRP